MPAPVTPRARRRAARRRNPECTCEHGPAIVGTFRDGYLVDVERRHWTGRDSCPIEDDHVDVSQYQPR